MALLLSDANQILTYYSIMWKKKIYNIEKHIFPLLLLVDGNWSIWGKWSLCSDDCGVGYQTRLRNCTNPKPLHGGLSCQGQKEETKQCGNPKEKCCRLSCCEEYELLGNNSVMYPKYEKVTPISKCCQHLVWERGQSKCRFIGMYNYFLKNIRYSPLIYNFVFKFKRNIIQSDLFALKKTKKKYFYF